MTSAGEQRAAADATHVASPDILDVYSVFRSAYGRRGIRPAVLG
jgi:hypothetical protein